MTRAERALRNQLTASAVGDCNYSPKILSAEPQQTKRKCVSLPLKKKLQLVTYKKIFNFKN
jgi:hypothetical protein